jgi:hypothetical protein
MHLKSKIKCPECGFEKEETMPKGDCCVYCSYGSVECPPKQEEKKKAEDTGFPKHPPLG